MPCLLAQLSCMIMGRQHITIVGIKRSLMQARLNGYELWAQQLSTQNLPLTQYKSLATTRTTIKFKSIRRHLHAGNGIVLRSTTTTIAQRQKYIQCNNTNTNNNNNKNNNVHERDQRTLVIFDFDMTIVAQDIDMVVAKILPPSKLNDLLNLIESDSWMSFMLKTLQYLQEEGITAAQLAQTVRCVPEVPGMVRLIHKVGCLPAFDVIIISDANTFFITEWLNAHNLRQLFTFIISNPAQPKCNGHLALSPFTQQTKCQDCPSNLCKGAIFEQLLADSKVNGINYKRIIYVGDGANDYCAVRRMQRCDDIICARRNFHLAAAVLHLSEERKLNDAAAAQKMPQIILWSDGCELLGRLQTETTIFSEMHANNG